LLATAENTWGEGCGGLTSRQAHASKTQPAAVIFGLDVLRADAQNAT
jgi:hypothetical protein